MIKKIIPFFLTLLLFSCFSTKRTAKKLAEGQEKVAKSDIKPKIIKYEQSLDSNIIYTIVEQMPEYPEGQDSLLAYLGKRVRYTQKAKNKGVSGKVYVKFVVAKTGEIKNIKVIRGIDEELDEIALNAVKNMPNWTPGKQRGKAVNVRFVLPIHFKLTTSNSTEKKISLPPIPPPPPPINDDKRHLKFPGGTEKMHDFIYKNLKYPTLAKENNIEGVIWCHLFISKTGEITKFTLNNSLGYGCDEEAKRIVRLMPNWIPATIKDEPIEDNIVIPISFKLK